MFFLPFSAKHALYQLRDVTQYILALGGLAVSNPGYVVFIIYGKTKQLFLITKKIQKLLPRGNSAHHAFSVLTKESGGRPTSIPSRRTLQLLPMDF